MAKNENNYKALFRKGKALGEQGFFEKSVKILEDLKSKNPTGAPHQKLDYVVSREAVIDAAAVDQEIARLRVIDNEREKVHKQKMKGESTFLEPDRVSDMLKLGFLNKGEKKAAPTASASDTV